MEVIRTRNVNDALVSGVELLKARGLQQDSRGGMTIEFPEPVCTVYDKPLERVLFDKERDANPFFHLMEAFWMLAGRRDVAWLVRFNKRMATYTDDGDPDHFNAAYGYRWRQEFKLEHHKGPSATDQLNTIVELLRADPDSRRAVLQIWSAGKDLKGGGRDCACNTQAMFKLRDKQLHMLVTNRSNDVIWGCYGANAVQFSMLLEYMAARIGVSPGTYRQMSDSYHAYEDTWEKVKDIAERYEGDPYERGEVKVYPLVKDKASFDAEMLRWVASSLPDADVGGAPLEDLSFSEWSAQSSSWRNPYFHEVATPIHNAWFAYKRKDRDAANQWLDRCAATDWQRAGREWLQRRGASQNYQLAKSA